MNYDEWKQRTPEEDRAMRESRRARPDPDDAVECGECGREVHPLHLNSVGLCERCAADPEKPDPDDEEEAEPTPLVEGDDPDDYIQDEYSNLFRDEGQGEGGP